MLPEKIPEQEEGQVDDSFAEALEFLKRDLALAAIQVREDRFQKNGIGAIGTLYRSMKAASGTAAENSQWSYFLDFTTILWDGEYHDATIKLLRDSQVRLSPPEIYRDTISDSLAFGEDYLIYLRANQRFAEGDAEGAAGLIRNMSEDARKPMEKELKSADYNRKKSRKLAFVSAGVAGFMCIAASSFSFYHMREFVKNPPTMTLPKIDITNIDELSSRLLSASDAAHSDQEATDPQISDAARATSPLQNKEYPPLDGSVIFDETSSGTSFESQPILSESAEDSSIIDDKGDDQKTAEISTGELSQCGLALRISSESTRLAQETLQNDHLNRAKDFQQAFFAACASIPAASIQKASEEFSEGMISSYAQGVLNPED